MIPTVIFLSALIAWPAGAQTGPEREIDFSVLPAPGCDDREPSDEIVVCGRRSDNERYRVPPSDRSTSRPAAGEIQRATTDLSAPGRCGMFQGQRQGCTRAEMEESGFYRGRDPISAATRAITAVLDPD